jgi:acyl-coenzyme A synthetase/AMP-(fatty) acid ligase
LQTHLFVGGSVFLDTRFMAPDVVLDAIGAEGCTGFAGVPLTFEVLRRQAQPDPLSMPALRYVTQAGGAMDEGTIDWVRAAFAPAKLFVMYGQTEATARLSCLPPERGADKRGSIGIPIPGVRLRVVDESGREMARGETGHLIASGPNVTPGYYAAPAETARILRDGWLWTGDLAICDADGFFTIVGRSKEILRIGGRRVSPAQIESVLSAHPDVAEVAVCGVPDPLLGEAAAAVVVARRGAEVSARTLRQLCTDRLPPPLVPRFVRICESLPRSPSGKVLRGEVARAFECEIAIAVSGGVR